MIRAIFLFLVFGAIIFAADWLLDRPGTIAISWQGLEVHESFAWGVGMLALVLLAAIVGFWLISWLLRSPWTLASRIGRSRRERGQTAISLGMVAIAAGDREEARRQSRRAAQLVPDQPLATLLAAQTAQLDGDEQAARRYFLRLAETPDTAFLGLRGLWMQAMKEGRTRDALHYVERAHEQQPNAAWVLEAQLTLQARLGQWDAAAETLEKLAKRKLRTVEQTREARALIHVERSRALAARGDVPDALAAARVAYKANPTLVPGVAQYARMQIASHRRGKAEKAIEEAWGLSPHPMLAEAYRGVVDTVTPEKQLDLARKLAAVKPNDPESAILVARFAMAANRWTDAAEALAPLTRRNPPARICRLMAEIEADGRNDLEAARNWLARAAGAPPDEAWVCRETGAVQAEWSAVCADSQLFGTLEWRIPYHLETAAPAMLEAATGRVVTGGAVTVTGAAVLADDGDASADAADADGVTVVEAVAEPVDADAPPRKAGAGA